MNEWIAIYLLACVVLGTSIYRRRGRARIVWPRLTLWLLAAAAIGIVDWGLIACSVMPLVEQLAPVSGLGDWGACVVASSFWSGAGVLFAMPVYALLLSWYLLRSGRELGGRTSVWRACCLLALPVGTAMLYGYGVPATGTGRNVIVGTVVPSAIGYLATMVALVVPRMVLRPLAPGQLVRADAA